MEVTKHIDALIYSVTAFIALLSLGGKFITEHFKSKRAETETDADEVEKLRRLITELQSEHEGHVQAFNARKEYLDEWQQSRDRRMKDMIARVEEVEDDNRKTRSAFRKFIDHEWRKIE